MGTPDIVSRGAAEKHHGARIARRCCARTGDNSFSFPIGSSLRVAA